MGMIIINGEEYASSPKDGFPPIIYSDEEREIGVWRDGKPLYQKTINIGSLPNNSSKSVAHNIANLDRIVNSFGYAQNNDWYVPIPLVSKSTSSSQVEIFMSNTIISIADGTDRSDYSGFVTLQYTKTTDIPGSGKYTTYGGLSHHYSTSEQVVGTWIDGKPIYECTWNFDTAILVPSNTWVDTSISVASKNIEGIVDCKAISSDYDSWGQISAGAGNGEYTYVKLHSSRPQYDSYVKVVTLKYTKTTD